MFKYDESVLRYSYLRLDESEITAIINSQDPAKTADDEPAAKDESTPAAAVSAAATDEPVADEASDNNETADIEI